MDKAKKPDFLTKTCPRCGEVAAVPIFPMRPAGESADKLWKMADKGLVWIDENHVGGMTGVTRHCMRCGHEWCEFPRGEWCDFTEEQRALDEKKKSQKKQVDEVIG